MSLLYLIIFMFCSFLHAEGGGDHAEKNETTSNSNSNLMPVAKPYFSVGPFKVCIIKNGDIKGYIMVQVFLMVGDDKEYETMKAMEMRFQSHFIISLSHVLHNLWIKGDEPNIFELKSFLMRCAKEVAGDDSIKDVLIKSYFYMKEEPKPKQK